MKRIFKYPLEVIDNQIVNMPLNAWILTVQYQDGRLCLWALVDETAPVVSRIIQIYGTGHECIGGNYLATVQKDGLVWHVFDCGTL